MHMVDMAIMKDYQYYYHCSIIIAMDFTQAFLLVHKVKVVKMDELNQIAVCSFKDVESQAVKKMNSQDDGNYLGYCDHPQQRQIKAKEDLPYSMDGFFIN